MSLPRHLIALIVLATGLSPARSLAEHEPRPISPDPLAYVAPSRDVDVIHTRLDLDLDLRGQRITGSVTHRLRPLKPGLRRIRLDCVGLDVEEVTVDGRPAEFDYPVAGELSTSWFENVDSRDPSDELVVHADGELRTDSEVELTIFYSGEPKQGLYFIAPEKGMREKRHEVWSQGEGEDNRFWIPCFDYPNDKATFEGIFRVDEGNYVLSNGILVDRRQVDGKTQFHWQLDTPQVSYLIMVAAGRYKVVEERWRDVPLLYVVPPNTDDATVRRGYGRTKDMMQFLSDYIGIDYPFKKYAQVVVQNFIYGGMENTTATVMNMRTLFDERAQLTRDEDGLVAHELAHQWWGDMVTCAEWSHLWLNEGFATYFQSLYRESVEGDAAFRYEMDRRHRDVITKDDRDARPMVVDFFNRRDTRNSANVYTKGASVLHMLRFLIGDELFRQSMRAYGERFKYRTAQTSDFVQVFRETTGENLDWFFEQWAYLTGHPKLKVATSWNAQSTTLQVSVTQTQEVSGLTPVFRLPVDIEITCAESTLQQRIIVDQASQQYFFRLPSKPKMVIFDKGDWLLKTLDFPKPARDLLYQLAHADAMGRVRAARALAKKEARPDIVRALRAILLDEGEFWGLRREAALALGRLGGDALDALLVAAEVENARVRLAAAEGLGDYRAERRAEDALIRLFERDPAYEVQARAVTSLVAMDAPAARDICLKALRKDSHRDWVRNAALDGLVSLRSLGAMSQIRALAAADQGNRRTYRHKAIASTAKLARHLERDGDREEVAGFLEEMLDDWYVHTRRSVIAALGTLGEKHSIDALQRVAESDPIARIRTQAARAVASIESGASDTADRADLEAEIKRLNATIEGLQKDVTELKSRLPRETQDSEDISRKDDDRR